MLPVSAWGSTTILKLTTKCYMLAQCICGIMHDQFTWFTDPMMNPTASDSKGTRWYHCSVMVQVMGSAVQELQSAS